MIFRDLNDPLAALPDSEIDPHRDYKTPSVAVIRKTDYARETDL